MILALSAAKDSDQLFLFLGDYIGSEDGDTLVILVEEAKVEVRRKLFIEDREWTIGEGSV